MTQLFLAMVGVQCGLLFALGLNVSLARNKSKVSGYFDPADKKYSSLYAAQRAHGSQSEWAPAFAILFLACHMMQAPTLVTFVAGWATVARCIHCYALAFTGSLVKPTPLRKYAAISTYLSGFVLSSFVIFQALM